MSNMTVYGHKIGVSGTKHFLIGSIACLFHAPFPLFSQCFYIRVISTKASNIQHLKN